ncbi:MAG: type IV pilus assembly protein PilM [Caldithrix sp.]|nr:MAG: type IV pilus assembly protein PilM [Caldithrix sp.]
MGGRDAKVKPENLDLDFLLQEKRKQQGESAEGTEPEAPASDSLSDESMILGSDSSIEFGLPDELALDSEEAQFPLSDEGAAADAGLGFDINDETLNLADALNRTLDSAPESAEQADDEQLAAGDILLPSDPSEVSEQLHDLALLESQEANSDADTSPSSQSTEHLTGDREKVSQEIETLMAEIQSAVSDPETDEAAPIFFKDAAADLDTEDESVASLLDAAPEDDKTDEPGFQLSDDAAPEVDSQPAADNTGIDAVETGSDFLDLSIAEQPQSAGDAAGQFSAEKMESLLEANPGEAQPPQDLNASNPEQQPQVPDAASPLDLALPTEPSGAATESDMARASSLPAAEKQKGESEKASPFASFLKENEGKPAGRTPKISHKKQPGSAQAKKKRRIFKTKISLTSVFANSRLLGLDVGSKGIKYVQLQKTAAGIKLINCGSFAAPETEQNAAREVVSERFGAAITKNFNARAFKNTLITTAVSGMEVLFKNVLIPKMGRKELTKAVPWACRKDFPFPIEATIFEFQSTSDKKSAADGKLDMIVVAVQKELISNHLEMLGRARVTPTKISTIPVALWSVFRVCVRKGTEGCYAVLDLGDASSHIVFVNNGHLQFARELSTAAGDFTRALTGDLFINGREIKLSIEQADTLKRKYGIPHEHDDSITEDGIPVKEIAVMVGPVVERLVNDIQRTVEFYKEKFKVDAIKKVYLTGGGAFMPNLASLLVRELNLKVSILNPFDTISLKKFGDQPRLASSGPRFAVAVGLALDRGRELNLLPREFKGSQTLQYLKRIYRYVLLILILTMAFLSQDISREFRAVEQRFKRLNTEFREGEPKRETFLALQHALQILTKAGQQYGNSLSADLSAATHLKVVGNYFPRNMTLTSLRIFKRERKVEGSENEFYSEQVVVLHGVAFANNSMEGINLAEFLIELEKLDYFSSISLKSQKIREDGSLQFTLECVI